MEIIASQKRSSSSFDSLSVGSIIIVPGDRPGNRRRVKAVIHQALGHVFHFDAGAFPLAQIQDAFVRDEAAFAFEENREICVQPLRDVVRVQDRNLGRFGQAFGAHHADVHPGDGQDAGAAVGRGGRPAPTAIVAIADCRIADAEMSREETARDVAATPIGPDAGAAAAVRDAKSLVQIQMANVRADVARTAEADLRVHVRAVHVNLAAVRVHDLANLADGRFENAVGGRIGDHERGEIVSCASRLSRADRRDRCRRLSGSAPARP